MAAAWAMAHGIADLIVADQLWFLREEVAADTDAVALGIMERLVLMAPGLSEEPPATPPH